MSFLKRFFSKYLLVSLFLLNAYCSFRLASSVSLVDKYRREVRQFAVDVSCLSTNFLASSRSTPSLPSPPSSPELTPCSDLSSIPYRYAVVRGVPGLTSGGSSWYPVGTLMPYGNLSTCSRDFACFNGRDWYNLSYE